MAPSSSDLRNTRRFSLQLPLTVKFAEGPEQSVSAQTKDVSARGVFFYRNSDIAEGSPIEFTLTLPPEITLTESIRVHCTGKVVRVEPQTPGRVGIAAVIERYEFLADQ